MNKMMMMAVACATMMTASAALVATDADHNLTGVYYSDGELALTSSPDVGKIEGNETEFYMLRFMNANGDVKFTVSFEAGKHTLTFPIAHVYNEYNTDYYMLEQLFEKWPMCEVAIYRDQDPYPYVKVGIARIGFIKVCDDGSLYWYSRKASGYVADSLPDPDADDDDEPTVDPEPTPEPTPTASKCPFISLLQKLFKRR